MAKFPPPEAFDFSRPEHWPEWRQRFQRYRTATKLSLEQCLPKWGPRPPGGPRGYCRGAAGGHKKNYIII
ncbi:unnamed protein product [Knipowitschia caucasica]